MRCHSRKRRGDHFLARDGVKRAVCLIGALVAACSGAAKTGKPDAAVADGAIPDDARPAGEANTTDAGAAAPDARDTAEGAATDAETAKADGGGAEMGAFVHPGCLSTQKDLDRMKAKVAANAQPWKGSWDRLVANSHAQATYTPNPQASICAGGTCASENYMALAHDAAAAYQLALRYHISGDATFAAKAAQILDAWAGKLTEFTGDSNAGLRAALYGYQLACAGELLRGYTAWDAKPLQQLLTTLIYPMNSGFLNKHNGACERNYWANWDLANTASVLAIGVFADRRDIFDEGIAYFRNGSGEGSIGNAIHYVHPDGSGQWQEAGRDQGHSTLGPMLMAVICEIAWNQGVDLYGYAGNRFLLGAEYVAAYNLGNDVPFVSYIYWSGPEGSCKQGVQTTVSASGRPSMRAGWELIYNHYVNRLGVAAPYTQQYATASRPEGGGGDYGGTSGGFDSLGFSTLTHTLDPVATGAVPSALRPFVQGRKITLSWLGSAYATGYHVKRAIVAGGPYTTVGTITDGRRFYVDAGLPPGTTYYYVVSATNPDGESRNSQEAAATADGQLFGTVIGTGGSYGSTGAGRDLAFDGSLKNFFDGPDSVSWVGLDLGEGAAATPTEIRYAPRSHFPGRMVGGKFQGSSTADFSADITDLFTITAPPAEGVLTVQSVAASKAFRYLRYLSPSGGYGNVAEVQFVGN